MEMKIPGQESQVTSPRSFSRSEDTVSFFSLPGRSCWPDAPRGLRRERRGVGMGQSPVALPGGFHVPRPRRSFRTHELCKGAMLPLDKETRSPGSPRPWWSRISCLWMLRPLWLPSRPSTQSFRCRLSHSRQTSLWLAEILEFVSRNQMGSN